jgi:YidC/Oxa1 family membrane protein insertase
MDRNSAIGLTLIAALLLAYFYWFAPEPQEVKENTTALTADPGKKTNDEQKTVQMDSAQIAAYGDFSSFVTGIENDATVETQDLKITLSNKGGILKEVELKKYKTYHQQPLKLITADRSKFNLKTTIKGKEVDLYSLYYKANQQRKGDSTEVTFSIQLTDGSAITQVYTIPDKGYEIKYKIRQNGLDNQIAGENLSFEWNDLIQPLEKDLQDTRDHSTVSFFTTSEGFDNISETSFDTEVIASPVKWVSIKQKFFLASLIAENTNFSSGEVTTMLADKADTSIVKHARVKLQLPKSALAKGANLKYYIGPNDYNLIGDVAENFNKNVYLGWPPVYWINKFIIFPVFHFLTKHIANYGLIIIVLVFLLRLVLAPLSYKSFLSMAKMKVLKPELDEIKEKHGDDMTKVQQEQMKLYQQVGVNPISGCIPVLLQMPILFAMFYLFPASIELRQQEFLWAEDLSTYDSLISFSFVIPFLGSHISIFTLLMTITTLIYTWQNNQMSSVTGPMKAMSYIMPIIFFFVLNRFSAGLTFYYTVGTLLTFGQQAVIKRFVDENKIRAIMDENRKKNVSGTAKKSKFMSRLEDAMKAGEEARKKADEERKKKKGN